MDCQIELQFSDRSSFSSVSPASSRTSEETCLAVSHSSSSHCDFGSSTSFTPNVSPTEAQPIEFYSQPPNNTAQNSTVRLIQPSSALLARQKSMILEDEAVKGFCEALQHLFGHFNRSSASGKSLRASSGEQNIRLATWWYLHSRMRLEPLLQQSSSSASSKTDKISALQQAHVDLAKTLWILNEKDSSDEGDHDNTLEEAKTWKEKNKIEVLSLGVGLFVRMRESIWAMKRSGLSPKKSSYVSVPEAVDMSLWILYPSLSVDVGYLITGYHTQTASDGNMPLSKTFPLDDTDDQFYYDRMHVDIYLLVKSADRPQNKYPAILSVMRSREDTDLFIVIGTQDGLVNFSISPSHDTFPTWKEVTWLTALDSLEVKLRTGFRLQLHFGHKDFNTLKKNNETLVFESRIKSTHYHGTGEPKPNMFPHSTVVNCTLRLFERISQWTSAAGLRRSHKGYRIAVLSPPSFKHISIISQQLSPGHVIHFGFPRGNNGNPTLSLKIDPNDSSTSLILEFAEPDQRGKLLATLTGCFLRGEEAVLAHTQLNKFSFTCLDFPTPAPMQAFNEIQWQSLGVINKHPLNSDNIGIESTHPIQSESLRIVVDSPAGRFTDRVNIGIGELKIRRNVIASGHELHVLRNPQDDATFVLSNLAVPSDLPGRLMKDLGSIEKQQTIRTYSFPSLSELHHFQSAITGFSILYDGVVSSFSISRRRMMIPIHKEWSPPFTRIQILRRGKRAQLAAFFEGFSHGRCMNFALKRTDIFEKCVKGGKIFLKMPDAKFSIPKGGKGDESAGGGFVCLDLLEYPGEHDNIYIGFDNELDFEAFSKVLPAPLKSNLRGADDSNRGLVKELQKFDQALLQVIALWQNYQESPELDELGRITKELAKDWRDELLAFRLKFTKKYGKSLSPKGSGNWFKDTGNKMVWLKEEILELRRKLHTASETLTMLIFAAMGKSNKLASTAQAVRVELVHGLLQESITLAEEQMSRLKIMDEKLDLQAKSSDMILKTVKSGITHIIDMKTVLSQVRCHILAQQTTPRGLGTHWQQAPVTLEDALGFLVPIPLELVNSWKMFDMILSERFEKHPGHWKVQRREYAIEGDATRRELSRPSEWSMCFRPGQKVDMSVLFSENDGSGNHCLRCRTKSEALSEAKFQCANPTCKMWFQRVVEIDDAEENTEIGRPEPKQQGSIANLSLRPTGPVLRPGGFQRVRLMSKISQRQRREQEHEKRLKEDLSEAGLDENQSRRGSSIRRGEEVYIECERIRERVPQEPPRDEYDTYRYIEAPESRGERRRRRSVTYEANPRVSGGLVKRERVVVEDGGKRLPKAELACVKQTRRTRT
ncbi:hypothetical protein G7Y89_g4976 [Cudoniella acicularis]|uniref:Uncharacterized protein n=1 Tax=Cudoniella acicularis TaxID=354080 RepID=A0A8H4RNC3_9HELO|nr:hypothetical protein G7Y89_g4976 [Cudoniella acicularis]